MRSPDILYALTTMIIILIWFFSIDCLNQKAAKWSCNVQGDELDGRSTEMETSETDCDKRGLFKSHFGCCPNQDCPVDHFSFHLRSGAANVVPPKICFNNTIIMGGAMNNAGPGLNIVLINGETGEILRSSYFNLESVAEDLLKYLNNIKPGNIILVASHINPAAKLNDEIRDIFAGLGSTMVKFINPKDNWVFAGSYGIKKAMPFEKLIHFNTENNAYGDWPEMVEIIGCFPRSFN
ncbi:protein FAM3C [Misgurnus anguillicaudatus]|uniref:protein FAM3C n=1 Tax=Misgurnus anguillicaudatus TaxID=75329 RepID=UPI003CCF64EA